MAKEIQNINGVPTLMLQSEADISGFELIDVRRDDEFTGELGHIKGAKLVTLGPELETFILNMDKNKEVLFICRSGARSANATLFAKQNGHEKVYNMNGGMMLWNQLGLPTEK
jgi:rhodanese-related sulfurtransferase